MIFLSLVILATLAYHTDHYVAQIHFFKASIKCSCILELIRVPESQVASKLLPKPSPTAFTSISRIISLCYNYDHIPHLQHTPVF